MSASRIRLLLGIIYSFGLSALLTYVPWYGNSPVFGHVQVGHAWVWDCPDGRAMLDLPTLAVEVGAWTAIVSALYLFTKLRDLKTFGAEIHSRA